MDRKVSFNPGDMSEEDARSIAAAANVAMVITNPRLDDNPIVHVNRAFEELTGYTSRMAMGRNCRFLQTSETNPRRIAELRRAIDAGEETSVVLMNRRANGETFYNALLIAPIRQGDEDRPAYFVGLQSEVNNDIASEELEKFETAVTEIQHRVKNHLSMILGLVRIEEREKDLGELSRRIESLQLLYEELSSAHRTSNEDTIPLGSYLGRVANAIAHLDGRPGVRMNIQVEPLTVETENAVRVGLIVSEILTNAMQHAFPEQETGLVELRVSRTDDGGMRAIVADDGVGLAEDVDWPGRGLGGQIVSRLCDGLGATLHVSRGAVGTTVTLDVPNAT